MTENNRQGPTPSVRLIKDVRLTEVSVTRELIVLLLIGRGAFRHEQVELLSREASPSFEAFVGNEETISFFFK